MYNGHGLTVRNRSQPPLPRPLALVRFCGRIYVSPSAALRSLKIDTGSGPRIYMRIVEGVAAGYGTMDKSFSQIGIREVWGEQHPVALSLADRRQHLYLIGKTGSGKTTLLRNLIVEHLLAGHGIGLIDPHGDLAEELLECIPPHRADDLVYFNPGDLDFPVGLNLIANVTPDERHLVASGIVSTFKSIWRDSWGPRLEYILYNAIMALLDCPNTSLLGINRMLIDADYRRRIVSKVRDPFIRSFWLDEYERYDPRFQREAIAPIQNKLGQFLLNPVVRNILGQVRTKVSIPFMMDGGRIFIANLSKGKLGADKAGLLGSLLTTQFQLAAMARVHQPENERRDFFLFIDEFHNFTTDSFAAILSEVRKYRLCLVLANQYIEQISPEVRSAIFGNVGSLISFRVGHGDAAILWREFGEVYPAESFVSLDRFCIIARLSQDGQTCDPVRVATLPPLQMKIGRRDKLIDRSRAKYATTRQEVEAKLARWMHDRNAEQLRTSKARIPFLPIKLP
ncbi:MAG: type IV secretion system DNA-binding domain-containing protein [Chthoniobacteraceae bacterium]